MNVVDEATSQTMNDLDFQIETKRQQLQACRQARTIEELQYECEYETLVARMTMKQCKLYQKLHSLKNLQHQRNHSTSGKGLSYFIQVMNDVKREVDSNSDNGDDTTCNQILRQDLDWPPELHQLALEKQGQLLQTYFYLGILCKHVALGEDYLFNLGDNGLSNIRKQMSSEHNINKFDLVSRINDTHEEILQMKHDYEITINEQQLQTRIEQDNQDYVKSNSRHIHAALDDIEDHLFDNDNQIHTTLPTTRPKANRQRTTDTEVDDSSDDEYEYDWDIDEPAQCQRNTKVDAVQKEDSRQVEDEAKAEGSQTATAMRRVNNSGWVDHVFLAFQNSKKIHDESDLDSKNDESHTGNNNTVYLGSSSRSRRKMTVSAVMDKLKEKKSTTFSSSSRLNEQQRNTNDTSNHERQQKYGLI